MPRHLDLELLSTLVAIADCGGFTRAAVRLHRTQSAVSLQMQRLEETAGVALFRAAGRRRLLTEQGEILVAHARRILAIHDEALGVLNATRVEGQIRFGSAQPFTERSLPAVLAQFTRLHPNMRLEVRVEPNQKLVESVHGGQLDLALVIQRIGAGGEPLRRLPLEWLVGDDASLLRVPVIPLALFEAPCPFREMALGALEREHREWRVAYTSPSLPGLLAAVRAGLGVTAQTILSLGPGLQIAGRGELPSLPEVEIALHRHPRAEERKVEPLAQLVRKVVDELA